MHATEMRKQFGKGLGGVVGNLPSRNYRHAYRCFEPIFWKTRGGNDDGGIFRTLRKRARRRDRDERGNDGSFQGFLPGERPRRPISLQEEMQ
jgi:hypothetical protein